jgi:tRNA-binding EMAP/Myf-like protein
VPTSHAVDPAGRLVLVLANLKPRALVGFKSHGMVLCASNDAHTEVKFVDVPPSAQVSISGGAPPRPCRSIVAHPWERLPGGRPCDLPSIPCHGGVDTGAGRQEEGRFSSCW